MYPLSESGVELTEKFCQDCHLLKLACLCAKVPILTSRAKWFLLVHERELAKGSNTGHLLLNAVENCSFQRWERRQVPEQLLALLASDQYQGYLLFPPDEDQPELSITPDSVSLDKIPVFILIDSTWQQARKMVRQSSYLKSLPRLNLSLTDKSQYRLRKNQQASGLSTCEAAIALLHEFGEPDNAQTLESYFLNFMRHYDASMSSHAVKVGE